MVFFAALRGPSRPFVEKGSCSRRPPCPSVSSVDKRCSSRPFAALRGKKKLQLPFSVPLRVLRGKMVFFAALHGQKRRFCSGISQKRKTSTSP